MVDAGDAMIASCETKHVNSFTRERALAVTEANARLIAAAPEMLEIVQVIAASRRKNDQGDTLVNDARALLAKIEGK